MIEEKRSILKKLCDIINPYSWITATRNLLFDYELIKSRKFTIPTICIGNITVGGTGKTPHTEYLIKLLKSKYRTAVLSRGYGRKSKGYILAEYDTPANQIGDEPYQIKKKFKDVEVAVCERRSVGIERILSESKETEIILLDDAFQHRHVKAGLNIVLIDSSRPIWKDCILPFGRMRESEYGIKRADIVIITKCKELTVEEREACIGHIKRIKNTPVFFSGMQYGELYPLYGCCTKRITKDMDVLLVTGIARPEPLKAELEKRCSKVTLIKFADHHNFNESDLKEIELQYNNLKSDNKIIVTTEKDAARLLQHTDKLETIRQEIHVLPIEIEILSEKELFNKLILDYVEENSRNR